MSQPSALARRPPPAVLVFASPWRRVQLTLGRETARHVACVAFAGLFVYAAGRVGIALGYSRLALKAVSQALLLVLGSPLLVNLGKGGGVVPRALHAAALYRRGKGPSPDAWHAAGRLRYELKPLADAAALRRCAALLSSGAFPDAGPIVPAALLALADAGALPRGCLLLELYSASPPPSKQPPISASRWAAPSPAHPPPPERPHRLLALCLARVAPRCGAAPLLGAGERSNRTAAAAALLGDSGAALDVVVLEVPLLGGPGVFVTSEVGALRAAALAAAAAAHLTTALSCDAALLPPPLHGAQAPLIAAAFVAAGAHPLPPLLSGLPDTHALPIPPHIQRAGTLAALTAALPRAQRRDVRKRSRAFRRAGGTAGVVALENVRDDPALAALLLGPTWPALLGMADSADVSDAASTTTSASGASLAVALAAAAAPPQEARVAPFTAAVAPPDGQLLPPLAAALMLQAASQPGAPPCCHVLAARSADGALLAAALAVVGGPVGRRTLSLRRAGLAPGVGPGRAGGLACGALLAASVELGLALGAAWVDLGPSGALLKARLGALPLPRTPWLLFADDRLAAAPAHPALTLGGTLALARHHLGAAQVLPPLPPPPPSLRRTKKVRAAGLRAGRRAEAARAAAALEAAAAAAAADVDGGCDAAGSDAESEASYATAGA